MGRRFRHWHWHCLCTVLRPADQLMGHRADDACACRATIMSIPQPPLALAVHWQPQAAHSPCRRAAAIQRQLALTRKAGRRLSAPSTPLLRLHHLPLPERMRGARISPVAQRPMLLAALSASLSTPRFSKRAGAGAGPTALFHPPQAARRVQAAGRRAARGRRVLGTRVPVPPAAVTTLRRPGSGASSSADASALASAATTPLLTAQAERAAAGTIRALPAPIAALRTGLPLSSTYSSRPCTRRPLRVAAPMRVCTPHPSLRARALSGQRTHAPSGRWAQVLKKPCRCRLLQRGSLHPPSAVRPGTPQLPASHCRPALPSPRPLPPQCPSAALAGHNARLCPP